MTGQQALVKLQSLDDRDFGVKDARKLIEELADKMSLGGSVRTEFTQRMEALFETEKTIRGKVVHIGRIILVKLADFVQENTGMLIGALIGVVLGSFLNMIPLVGQILAGLATFLGASVGAYLDAVKSGEAQKADNLLEKIIIGATHAFKQFIKLVQEIMVALKDTK